MNAFTFLPLLIVFHGHIANSLYQQCFDNDCADNTYVCTDNECTIVCWEDNSCEKTTWICNGTEVDNNAFCHVECWSKESCWMMNIYSEYRDYKMTCDAQKSCKQSNINIVSDASQNFSIRSDLIVYSYTETFQHSNYTCAGDNIYACNLFLNDSDGTGSRCRRTDFNCDSPSCRVFCPTDSTNCGNAVRLVYNIYTVQFIFKFILHTFYFVFFFVFFNLKLYRIV